LKIGHYIYIAIAAMMSACSEQNVYDESQQQVNRMPVLFSAGNTDATLTRATASYMPENSRFVCSMFFHAGVNDDNDSKFGTPISDVNMTTSWLKINNKIGNAVYWNKFYAGATGTDTYGFDEDAKCFYWQNRLNHIFIALTDYNKLDSEDGSETGTLKLYPEIQDQYKDQYMLAYDLTKGEKNAMAEQPDPIQAVTTMSPTGATPESNRVKLFFRHQFSQIQVNLKNSQDTSVSIDEALIENVELLGVAETGYVAYCINSDGTVPSTTSEPINIDDKKYKDTKKDNPYGSSFSLFVRQSPVPGYLKSFEGIAFGTLQGIRITWKESNAPDAVKHVTTYKGVKNKTLESGKKYIYNMELRRSLIAQVKAEVVSWDLDQTDYQADGTIQDTNI
jgi:hypothetical protein